MVRVIDESGEDYLYPWDWSNTAWNAFLSLHNGLLRLYRTISVSRESLLSVRKTPGIKTQAKATQLPPIRRVEIAAQKTK